MAEPGFESKKSGTGVLVLNHGEFMNTCLNKCLSIILLYQYYAAKVFEVCFCNYICCFKMSKQVQCHHFMDGETEAQRRISAPGPQQPVPD